MWYFFTRFSPYLSTINIQFQLAECVTERHIDAETRSIAMFIRLRPSTCTLFRFILRDSPLKAID